MTKTKKGFTLIELLVVIAIIGILSAIGLAAFSGTRERARDVKRVADLRQYGLAMEAIADNNGDYDLAVGCTAGLQLNTCGDFTAATGPFSGNPPGDPGNPTAVCADAAANLCCDGAGNYRLAATSSTDFTFTADIESSRAPTGFPATTTAIKVTRSGVTQCTPI